MPAAVTRPTAHRHASIPLLGAVLIVASVGAGCAAGISEVASRMAAPVTPEAPPDASFATFVADGGFDALPSVDVLLGGTSDTDAALRVAAVLADTPEARARGLMGVTTVPDGVGMLFTFPDATGPERPGFWMLDTLVPLDIAFAADGVIVGVATMRPCPAAPCPVTHPGVDYDVALEVAAGALGAAGVGPGDRFVRRAASGTRGDAG